MNINWEAVIKDRGEISYNGKTLAFIFSKNQSVFIVTEENKTAQNGLIDCPFVYPIHIQDFYAGYEYYEQEQAKVNQND